MTTAGEYAPVSTADLRTLRRKRETTTKERYNAGSVDRNNPRKGRETVVFPTSVMNDENGALTKMTEAVRAMSPAMSTYETQAVIIRMITSEMMRAHPGSNYDKPSGNRTFANLCGVVIYPLVKQAAAEGNDPVEFLIHMYGISEAQADYLVQQVKV